MKEQFDLFESRKERDKKLDLVAEKSGDFMKLGLLAISFLPSGDYTGEDIRVILTEKSITPHHPNAWGSLIRQSLLKKLINDTGTSTQMKSKKSHARKTSVYKVIK